MGLFNACLGRNDLLPPAGFPCLMLFLGGLLLSLAGTDCFSCSLMLAGADRFSCSLMLAGADRFSRSLKLAWVSARFALHFFKVVAASTPQCRSIPLRSISLTGFAL